MLTALIAAAWVGAILIFIVTVSPTVFQALSMEQASRFLRAYFPKLFLLELTVGASLVFSGLTYAQWWFAMSGFAIAAMAALNYWVLLPAINRVSDDLSALAEPDPRLKRQFGRLHGASTVLFGLGGLLSLYILGAYWRESQ